MNKRTTTAVMDAFLCMNGQRFNPRHDDLLKTMMGVADGSVTIYQLAKWVALKIKE